MLPLWLTFVVIAMKVTYRADVPWYSPDGTLVRFTESGVKTVPSDTTMTTIYQLLPSTEYRFKVSAVTEYGRGAEVIVVQSTTQAYDGQPG